MERTDDNGSSAIMEGKTAAASVSEKKTSGDSWSSRVKKPSTASNKGTSMLGGASIRGVVDYQSTSEPVHLQKSSIATTGEQADQDSGAVAVTTDSKNQDRGATKAAVAVAARMAVAVGLPSFASGFEGNEQHVKEKTMRTCPSTFTTTKAVTPTKAAANTKDFSSAKELVDGKERTSSLAAAAPKNQEATKKNNNDDKDVAPFTGKSPQQQTETSSEASDLLEDGYYAVEEVIDVKLERRSGKKLYRIRWAGFSKEHDTWEPAENLKEDVIIEGNNLELQKEGNNAKKRKVDKSTTSVKSTKKKRRSLHKPAPAPASGTSGKKISSGEVVDKDEALDKRGDTKAQEQMSNKKSDETTAGAAASECMVM